ncbi:MAG: FAD-binding oxidoreductase [Brevibacterium sp.]|uniref:NAD(P)/FAD-dependent oxidoreductase n=1 Tax=Brevibacterium sp. TaxID=1701 RepID=UPI0026473C7C|nr:FAD-binding oxidoreductase [Brevibacterium sp.]MDN5806590.1 FAD-binding oxidoreductase [Brevibacterium sp.]MDN5833023.1 FAD-binding oxidoreductase [Brevibacterium sp.]MDN5877027.1 FAD-binding oxidoreductase [Brevibacterium sp.]MDN5908106.1 FAD-binding oxidoreductase [Brevibacterium sp.]MDN6134276.1 FAD-binding oxidoreductase [Brevibacterium sp.]
MESTSTTPGSAEVVIIGAGVMGASIAYHLAKHGVNDIVLVERDTPGSGSTSKAAGGVRCQFSDEVNIALATRSLEVLRNFEAEFGIDIDLVSNGYLFLLDSAEDAEAFAANVDLQQRMGLDSQMLTVAEVAELAPYISTEGLVAGAFNPRDGHCTPEAVVSGYVSAARDRGVQILKNCEVTGFEASGADSVGDEHGRKVTAVTTDKGTIECSQVVCAAGAWSGLIGEAAGVDLPVRPLRREIMVSEPVDEGALGIDLARMPFTIDFSTSFYVHPEGPSLLFGCPDEADVWEFDDKRSPDWLPTLAELIESRAPALGDVEPKSGWAGLYEMTPDHNALIGEAEELSGFFYACGFSGHGFLMGPAVGEVVADLMTGRQPFVDVSGLDKRRFATSGLRKELNIV